MLKRGQMIGLVMSCVVTKMNKVKHQRCVRKICRALQDRVMTWIPVKKARV